MNTNARDLLFGGELPSGFPPPPPVAPPSHAALAISGAADAPLPSREERWAMKQRQRMQQMQNSQPQGQSTQGGFVVSNQASIPAAPGALPSALVGGGGLTLADRLKAKATTDPSFASGFSPRAPQPIREPEYIQPRIPQPVIPPNSAQTAPNVPWDAEKAYTQQYFPQPKQQQQQQQQQSHFNQFDQNGSQWPQPPSQQQLGGEGGKRGEGGGGSSYFDSISSLAPQITVGKAVQLLNVENGNQQKQQQPRGADALSFPPSTNSASSAAGTVKGILPMGGSSPAKSSQQSKQSYGDELMKQQEAKERQREEQKRREKEEASSARGILSSNSQNHNHQNGFSSPQRKQQEQQHHYQQQQQPQHFDNPVISKAQLLRAAAMAAEPSQEQMLGLPSMASQGVVAIAAKKSAYGDELQRQARLREEAKNKEKELERNEAKKSLGLAAIVAASENHGRGMAPAEKRMEMHQFAGQRVSQNHQQQQQQQRSNAPQGYQDADAFLGSSPASGDFSRLVSSRSPLQAEADARFEGRIELPNGPLGGLSSKQQMQSGHDKELYKLELQRQMQEKESQKVKSKLEALNPLHVPDGREGERQKHRAIVIQAQQQHQQAFLAARALDEAENRMAQQHQQQSFPQEPFVPNSSSSNSNIPQSFPGGPHFQSIMPEPSPTNNSLLRRHQRPAERFSPVSFNLSSVPQEDIAARKRLEYAADLERQVLDAKMRKEAEKRAAEERERRLEMEAVEYAREQALRKARGGNGEPLRDIDGRVLTDVKSVAAANKSSLLGVSGGRQNMQQMQQVEQPQVQAPMQMMYNGFSGPSSVSARNDLFGGNSGPSEAGFQSFPPPSQFPSHSYQQPQPAYGGQQLLTQAVPPTSQAFLSQAPFLDRQYTVSSSITRPVSPTEQARKSRLQMENAIALEQQIEEIRRKKAEETARRKIEEAAEEERLSKERQELGDKFKREEKERQQREQEDLDKALQAQIEAKNKERADERERERILEERAEAKLRQQNKELQEKYKESHPQENGTGSDTIVASANTSPTVQDALMNQRGGIAPVGAAARRLELFGPSSSTSPSTIEQTSLFPPAGTRFLDSSPAQIEPQRAPQPFQQQQPPQRWAPPPFFPAAPPAPPPVDPMLDPRVQQRISAAEEELERLRNALSELHVQTNDNRFADGLQRLGLSVPGSQQEKELQQKAALQRQIEHQRATAQPLTLFPPSAPLPLRTVSFAGLAKAAPSSNQLPDHSSPSSLDISLGGSSRLLASSSGLDASLWEPMKDAHVSPKSVLNKLESLEPHQHEERGKHMHDLLRSLFPDLNVIGADQLTSPQSVGKPPALHHENDLNEHQSNITSSEVDESRESSRPLGQSFKSLQQNHQNRDFNSSSSSSENSNFVISNINSNNNKSSSSSKNNSENSSNNNNSGGDVHDKNDVVVEGQLQTNAESGNQLQSNNDGGSRLQFNTESRSRSQTSRNETDIIDSPVPFQPPEHGSEHNSAEKRKSLVGSFLNHFGEPEHSPTSSIEDKNRTSPDPLSSSIDQQAGDESFAPPDMLRISKHFKGKDSRLFQEDDEVDEAGVRSKSPITKANPQALAKSLYSSSPVADDDLVSAIVTENKRKLEILEKKGSLHPAIALGAPPLSSHASARSSVISHLRPYASVSVAATAKAKRSEIDGHSKHIPLLEHEGDDYHTPDNLHPSSRYKDVISASQRMTQNRSIQPSSGNVEYDDDNDNDDGLIVDSSKFGRSRNSRYQEGGIDRVDIAADQYRNDDIYRERGAYRPRQENDEPSRQDDGLRHKADEDRQFSYNRRGRGDFVAHESREVEYARRDRAYDNDDNRDRGGAVYRDGRGYANSRGSARRTPIPVRERDYRGGDSQYYDDHDEPTRYYSYRTAEDEEYYHAERTDRAKIRRDPRRTMQYEDDLSDRRRRYPPPPQQYRDYR
jgi:hypothetical protein